MTYFGETAFYGPKDAQTVPLDQFATESEDSTDHTKTNENPN